MLQVTSPCWFPTKDWTQPNGNFLMRNPLPKEIVFEKLPQKEETPSHITTRQHCTSNSTAQYRNHKLLLSWLNNVTCHNKQNRAMHNQPFTNQRSQQQWPYPTTHWQKLSSKLFSMYIVDYSSQTSTRKPHKIKTPTLPFSMYGKGAYGSNQQHLYWTVKEESSKWHESKIERNN